ncbi:hypothetical protein M758_3G174600 [Ceratodon purpureus]|nr:hypothetical protein M758_3G174600 [Ceratodon purpureus]
MEFMFETQEEWLLRNDSMLISSSNAALSHLGQYSLNYHFVYVPETCHVSRFAGKV